MNIFDMIITRPFGWVLWAILQLVNNYGVALILFSIFAKLILYPFARKGKKGMLAQQRIQPKTQELQKKYGANKQKYSEELQKLYQEEKVSPMAGCLPQLIVIPIMFGLYGVIQKPLSFIMGISDQVIQTIADRLATLSPALADISQNALNNQIRIAESVGPYMDKFTDIPELMPIRFNFLGMDLSGTPNIQNLSLLVLLPILSGITAFLMSYITQKMTAKATGVPNTMAGANKALVYMMPLMSVWIGFSLPAGITLYWITNNLLSILQEWIMTKDVSRTIAASERIKELEEDRKQRKREEARIAQIELAKSGASPVKTEALPKSKNKRPKYTMKKLEDKGNTQASRESEEEAGAPGKTEDRDMKGSD